MSDLPPCPPAVDPDRWANDPELRARWERLRAVRDMPQHRRPHPTRDPRRWFGRRGA